MALSRRDLLAAAGLSAIPAAATAAGLDTHSFDKRFGSADASDSLEVRTANTEPSDVFDASGNRGAWETAPAAGRPSVRLDAKGLGPGADITDAIVFLIASNPGGIDLVLPPGAWTLRFKSVVVPSNTRIRGALPGATVLRCVPGRQGNPEAYGDCAFSFLPGTEHVKIEDLRLSGPNRYFAVAIASQTSFLSLDGIDSGNMALLWTSRVSQAKGYSPPGGWDEFTACKNITVRGCRGIGSRSRKGDDGRSQWIDAAYVHRLHVERCIASNYAHGIQIWGGNAATNAGPDWNSGGRGAKVATIRDCIITDMMLGGIWASRAEKVSVVGCHVARCGDVGIDFEGCADCEATGGSVEDCRNALLSVFFGARKIAFRGISLTFTNAAIWSDGGTSRFFGSWNASNDATRQQQVVLDGLICRSESLDPKGGYPMITTGLGAVFDLAVKDCSLHNGRIVLNALNGQYYHVEGNRLMAVLPPRAPQDLVYAGRTGGSPTLERQNQIVIRDNFIESRVAFPGESAAIHIAHDSHGRRIDNAVDGNIVKYAAGALAAPIAFTNAMRNGASEFSAFVTGNTIPPGTAIRVDESRAEIRAAIHVSDLRVSGGGRIRGGIAPTLFGDASISLTATSPEIAICAGSPLTVPRDVSLPADGSVPAGMTFRIVRAGDASGEVLSILTADQGPIAALSEPGTFVDVVFVGKVWMAIGSGRVG